MAQIFTIQTGTGNTKEENLSLSQKATTVTILEPKDVERITQSVIQSNNKDVLSEIKYIKNSLKSINDRLDDKNKEQWFFKNLKSANTTAAIVSTLLIMLIAKCNGWIDKNSKLEESDQIRKMEQIADNRYDQRSQKNTTKKL